MKLAVRNGTLVTPWGRYEADIECQDGRIAALVARGKSSGGDEEVNATGLLGRVCKAVNLGGCAEES